MNNAVGFIGMAIGSIVGGLPDLIHGSSPLENYRPVFLTIAVFSLLCILIILRIPEVKNRSANEPIHEEQARTEAQQEKQVRKKENHALTVLALVNVLNGLAVGLTGPMMAYWFRLRYGASTGAIGATLSISFLLTGIFSILSGRIAARMGMVKSVTWMHIIGSICMLALAFMPTFTLASLFFILRNAINRATQGNRNALSASLTRDKRRGLATSINALTMRLPSSIGPTISGYLFDADLLSLPLILTAVLQLANAGLYQWVFGRWDQQMPSPSHEKE
ncbi:MAG: MFS transporter [Acidibacillus sp.]|nr:MFS transporter [Acidibacillus sp.]